jgi:prepilin-type N-terminal cleavage/methylation domain-containing protein
MNKAFSLVELMIVVAVLGILAAIVVPQFQSHTTDAKASAAKANLRTLRGAIELYTAQHSGVPPGYLADQLVPSWLLPLQLIFYTDGEGNAAGTKSLVFRYGPYLKRIPKNPFNDETTIRMLADAEPFPGSADGSFAWIYKPATKRIRMDWPGTDKSGVSYYDY